MKKNQNMLNAIHNTGNNKWSNNETGDMKKHELKPCPLCGKKVAVTMWYGCWVVGCTTPWCRGNTEATVQTYSSAERAIAAWRKKTSHIELVYSNSDDKEFNSEVANK